MKKFFKVVKWVVIVLIVIAILLAVITYFYMKKPLFGKVAEGERLERIKQSPNYKNGSFQNLNHTPSLTEGYTMAGIIMIKFLAIIRI